MRKFVVVLMPAFAASIAAAQDVGRYDVLFIAIDDLNEAPVPDSRAARAPGRES